ncbi:hypothetical protein [Kamptonema formosum]|uniref:hypothetical protein n=1 Tax=Kamptonema formosum TaxID=331992 RepID=UPI000346BFBF|nr:hypothetical protein [Oscillatoria sp. PCC 10802]
MLPHKSLSPPVRLKPMPVHKRKSLFPPAQQTIPFPLQKPDNSATGSNAPDTLLIGAPAEDSLPADNPQTHAGAQAQDSVPAGTADNSLPTVETHNSLTGSNAPDTLLIGAPAQESLAAGAQPSNSPTGTQPSHSHTGTLADDTNTGGASNDALCR